MSAIKIGFSSDPLRLGDAVACFVYSILLSLQRIQSAEPPEKNRFFIFIACNFSLRKERIFPNTQPAADSEFVHFRKQIQLKVAIIRSPTFPLVEDFPLIYLRKIKFSLSIGSSNGWRTRASFECELIWRAFLLFFLLERALIWHA